MIRIITVNNKGIKMSNKKKKRNKINLVGNKNHRKLLLIAIMLI